eukprot:5840528-Amphidinium_carterae.1
MPQVCTAYYITPSTENKLKPYTQKCTKHQNKQCWHKMWVEQFQIRLPLLRFFGSTPLFEPIRMKVKEEAI